MKEYTDKELIELQTERIRFLEAMFPRLHVLYEKELRKNGMLWKDIPTPLQTRERLKKDNWEDNA